MELANAIEKYKDHLLKHVRENMTPSNNENVIILNGEGMHKYAKLVTADSVGNLFAVISFVVMKEDAKFKIGDILKASNWSAPTKNFARGNVFNPESYANHTSYGL